MDYEYLIYRNGEPVADGFTSEYAAEYQLEHNQSPGGIWDGDRAKFTVKKVLRSDAGR